MRQAIIIGILALLAAGARADKVMLEAEPYSVLALAITVETPGEAVLTVTGAGITTETRTLAVVDGAASEIIGVDLPAGGEVRVELAVAGKVTTSGPVKMRDALEIVAAQPAALAKALDDALGAGSANKLRQHLIGGQVKAMRAEAVKAAKLEAAADAIEARPSKPKEGAGVEAAKP